MCSPPSSELNWECPRLRNHWSSLQESSSPDASPALIPASGCAQRSSQKPVHGTGSLLPVQGSFALQMMGSEDTLHFCDDQKPEGFGALM